MSAEQLPFAVKRHLFLTSSLEPVAEVEARAVQGRSYFHLADGREFIRRADLATATTEVYVELPQLSHLIADREVIRWFA